MQATPLLLENKIMIRIDGSSGEGGGQILRTSLSLSLATGQLSHRERPRQAGTPRTAPAAPHGGSCSRGNRRCASQGASLGSRALSFVPGTVRPGEHRFVIGTAGSGTLVLQTILPALMTAPGTSRVVLEGGTHNMQAPPFDFLQKTFLPLLGRMGPKVSVSIERYGFYPAGGGRFVAEIEPCEKLSPLVLSERGGVTERRVVAIVANLARSIARRELDTVAHHLNWPADALEILETKDSRGPGNVVMIEIGDGEFRLVFTGFGRLGASAEKVASEAAGEARAYLSSSAVADEHLTDQLLLPIALGGSGAFTATKLSMHARTNIEVISLFLDVRFATHNKEDAVLVEVMPRA